MSNEGCPFTLQYLVPYFEDTLSPVTRTAQLSVGEQGDLAEGKMIDGIEKFHFAACWGAVDGASPLGPDCLQALEAALVVGSFHTFRLIGRVAHSELFVWQRFWCDSSHLISVNGVLST